jgi:hypothetical protein
MLESCSPSHREAERRVPACRRRNNNGRAQLRQAAAFLAELAERGRRLNDLDQAELERWHASATPTEQHLLRPFLLWLTNRRQTRRLQLPPASRATAPALDQQQRLALIRRIHDDPTIELIDRIVAMLILLYAQPLSRIARLTLADVHVGDDTEDDSVLPRLGDPPVPIPPPFNQLLRAHLAARPNSTTATNPTGQWLFPGRRANQPIHPSSLRLRMRTLGVPNLNGRMAAIRHILQEAPAPGWSLACSATARRAPRTSRPPPARDGSATSPAATSYRWQ